MRCAKCIWHRQEGVGFDKHGRCYVHGGWGVYCDGRKRACEQAIALSEASDALKEERRQIFRLLIPQNNPTMETPPTR